ncbi:MAG: hybrid sensor histidine kinase/response regulator [Candidatus Omnitrophica bacterium]|nr:hybrid sensor histidine kinase/response regulator [Candidatus Omnitrophota bacterium]
MGFDKSEFIDGFKAEAREHIENLNLGFIKFEKNQDDKELLKHLMGEAHTIKGAAAMMEFKRISEIAHIIEDAMEASIERNTKFEREHFNILFEALDAMGSLLEDKVTWKAKGVDRPYVEELCRRLSELLINAEKVQGKQQEKVTEKVEPKEVPAQDPFDTKKKNIPKTEKRIEPTCEITETSLRVDVAKVDTLLNSSSELLISKIRLKEVVKELVTNARQKSNGIDYSKLLSITDNIDSLTSQMQKKVMDIRLIPASYLFNSYPRIMRELANENGKAINFEIEGEDTTLDKAILDKLKSPLMHILRNAIDHGIETKEARKKINKPEEGTIKLKAYREGTQVVVEVDDDGDGIDIAKVKETAVKKQMVPVERIGEMQDDQALQLLFTPGFSTKENVTDLSGRGVGLDVVRSMIASLKGMIEITTKKGEGSKFIIKLPLTLAISECLLVLAGNDKFAIPIDSVAETMRIEANEIKSIENKNVISVRNHIIPLVRLNDIFSLPTRGILEKRTYIIIILQFVERKVALLVDDLLGRENVVSRDIGDPLKKVKDIGGATILGDGKVIFILDVPSIVDSSEGYFVRRTVKDETEDKGSKTIKKQKNILLAEDVLSTAMMEKNILESVGYNVILAKDGQDAYEKSSTEKFDLVISDVLMPRKNGFELVEALRQTKEYRNVPVIMVTTRGSEKDKLRGLEVGADAYILKNEFTSDVLLETIDRLLG